MPPYTIETVDGSDATPLQHVIDLVDAYTSSLGIDLSFQDLEAEMAGMPGKYGPPRGTLLLARDSRGRPVGSVGLCPVEPGDGRTGCCEMKRLYVAPGGRGTGVGRALVEAVKDKASRLGYREMLLDSMPSMAAAQALYRSAGFVECEPYYANPNAGVVYMALRLPKPEDARC